MIRRSFFAALLLASCTVPPAGASDRIDIDDPAQCEPCHQEITREWRESMHAIAFRGDPIYENILAVRKKKEGANLEENCTPCHQPRASKTAGVTCATCHNIARLKNEGRGAKRFELAAADLLTGPHDLKPGRTPAHETGPRAPHLTDGSSVCLACHDSLDNPAKVSLCATGIEWRSGGKDAPTCTSCHMPRTPGAGTVATAYTDHAEHRFLGPARARRFDDNRRSAGMPVLELEHRDQLIVRVDNKTSHAYPTGFPGRVATLYVRGLDEKNLVVFTSSAALAKTFFDKDHKPVMGPYGVVSKDSRLGPREKRAFTFKTPAKAVRFEAEIRDLLIAPPLAKTLGMEKSREAEPRVVAKASLSRL